MEEKTTTCVNLITGDRDDRYVCGNCGTVFYIEDGREVRKQISYCPVCGYKFMEVKPL